MLGKSITYLIIAIQIFNLVGVTISIELHRVIYQKQLKNSLSKLIDSSKFKKFEFKNEQEAKQALHFTEEDEFNYAGQLYDLVKSEYKNSTYIITAFEDSKEQELTVNLTKEDFNLAKKSKNIKSIEYQKLINLPIAEFVFSQSYSIIRHFQTITNSYSFLFFQSEEQPPELI